MLVLTLSFALDQLKALQELFAATDGEHWLEKANWETGDFCAFAGVSCEGGKVAALQLMSIEMKGALPNSQNFLELVSGLTSLQLGYNSRLKGTLPKMPNLTTLFLTGCQVAFKIEDTPRIKKLNIDFFDFKDVVFPYPISQLASMNILNCGFVFPEQTVDFTGFMFAGLMWANNNFSKVTVTEFGIAQYYVLTNTGVIGTIDLAKLPSVRELSLAGSKVKVINFKLQPSFMTVDCPGLSIEGLLDFSDINDLTKLGILNLKKNLLQGLAPTYETISKLTSLPNLIVLDLSWNPFLCNAKSDDAFDCQVLIIQSVQKEGQKIIVKFNDQKNLGKLNLTSFKLAVRDFTKSDKDNVATTILDKCITNLSSMTISCDYEIDHEIVKDDVVILYENQVVSSGALRVQEDVNNELKKVEDFFNYTYLQRHASNQEAETKKKSPIFDSLVEKIVKVETGGISRCPDCTSFFLEVIEPFYAKYPQIARYVDYEFVSMTKIVPGQTGYGYAMHGQTEAMVDVLLLCMQKIDKDVFFRYSSCFDVNQQANSCLKEAIPEYQDQVMDCFEDESLVLEMLNENDERLVDFDISSAPTTFVQGKFACAWHYMCAWESMEDFKDYVCELPEMVGKC